MCVIWCIRSTTDGPVYSVFRNKYSYLLEIINTFVYRKCQLKSRLDVVIWL